MPTITTRITEYHQFSTTMRFEHIFFCPNGYQTGFLQAFQQLFKQLVL